MPTSYADSAQARESNRRWDFPERTPQSRAALFHEYTEKDLAEREVRRLAERASLKRRIGLVMAQMESICPPVGGET